MGNRILTGEELNQKLYEYYIEHYKAIDTDIWFEKPAVNVCVFKRGNRFISLKAHILTGEIEESFELDESMK